MNRDDLLRYDQRVPRYTSYPTAADFSPAVDAGCYKDWLTTLPAGEAVSLYLHIPFCRELCWFCGCHTTVARGARPVDAYLALLEREIDLLAGLCGGADEAAAEFAENLAALAPLEAQGVVRVDGYRVRVMPEARLLLRVVCAVFDRRLRRHAERHAVAV